MKGVEHAGGDASVAFACTFLVYDIHMYLL